MSAADVINSFRAGVQDKYAADQKASQNKFKQLATQYVSSSPEQRDSIGAQLYGIDPAGAEKLVGFTQQQNDLRAADAARQAKQTAFKLYSVANAPEGQAEGVYQAVAPDDYQKAIQGGLITQDMQPQQRDQLIRQVAQQHLPAYMSQAGISTAPELKSVGKDQSLIAVSPMGGAPKNIYQGQTADISPVKPEDFDPASVAKFKQTGNFTDLKRVYAPSNGQASAQSSIDAYKNDPALRRTAAIVVASDPARMRDYATFGAAGQGIRTQINQEIGQVKKETGMSDSDFVALRARAKADATNLTKLTAQNAQIEQAEGLMKANGQRALDLINMIDVTGVPLVEGLRRSAKAKMGGVNEAELKSVMTAFQAEVARLLTSGPTMNGVLSDSARAEVAHMSPESMSADQAKRVINRIFTEADIRHNLNVDQINKAAGGIPVGASPTPPQNPTPQQVSPPQPGEQTATGQNGQKIVLRNGQWVPL